jgi:hypothetical protein
MGGRLAQPQSVLTQATTVQGRRRLVSFAFALDGTDLCMVQIAYAEGCSLLGTTFGRLVIVYPGTRVAQTGRMANSLGAPEGTRAEANPGPASMQTGTARAYRLPG